MKNNDCPEADSGASKQAARPQTNTPAHTEVEKKGEEDKVIGIGSPMSGEELARLKEKAKKMDK